jgi:hypothetical protein
VNVPEADLVKFPVKLMSLASVTAPPMFTVTLPNCFVPESKLPVPSTAQVDPVPPKVYVIPVTKVTAPETVMVMLLVCVKVLA